MESAVRSTLRPGAPGILARWHELVPEGRALPLTGGEQDRLKERHGDAVARFVSLQLELARRAGGRFVDGRITFATSKGLEQATAPAVADRRAERFAAAAAACHAAGGQTPLVWDAGCGIGSDAVALARAVPLLLLSDLDPDAVACAAANVSVDRERHPGGLKSGLDGGSSGGAVGWAVADTLKPPVALGSTLLLVDPDRRPAAAAGRRERSPDHWAPPLDAVIERLRAALGGAVKLPPGLDPQALEPLLAGTRHELEWVSLDGEMKELTLYFGALADEGRAGARSAVRLASSSPSAAAIFRGEVGAEPTWPEPALGSPVGGNGDGTQGLEGRWLVDLDVSLWQAGLAGAFSDSHRLAPLGPEPRSFLVVDELAGGDALGPLARAWRILGAASADRKRVRALLREHGVGPLVVSTRSYPVPADELERRFRGQGARRARLAVQRTGAGSLAVLVEDPGS